ncbi:hypothetical protein [Actinomadura parmotrematis]|uniref:Integral membrane protein n=1 Tax=Actinomadura parmotrematis TaxID=2864039 RepID=A0ABS7FW82_9ACTN|nr:hypothetical protein [Actinomadura parmotrematis]MBW8484682.1 hypothetical protein [Actinomadura parmotrematis]
MVTLDATVARAVGAVLLLSLSAVYFVSLPLAFAQDGYFGVIVLLAAVVPFAGAAALCAEGRDRVWWYVLADGLLNAGGVVATRTAGLPFVPHRVTGWERHDTLTLLFLGLSSGGLAAWVLVARWLARTRLRPVLSAGERAERRAVTEGSPPTTPED